ncbi:iron hydroxylase [Nocardia mangyaensis]|uniref:Iron hydroxylase n=2 Tax=Nocardia mangyaensis TaxID=2213200 RepID=A0A1J0VXZ8_9NOCA|nr:iron hydroxylase [Nocardia mangyaensis]
MKSVLSERMTLHLHDIEHRELEPGAAAAVRSLAHDLRHRLGDETHTTTLHDPALLAEIEQCVGELPDSVRDAVRPPATAAGATVVRGLRVEDPEFGPTPRDWRAAAESAHSGSLELDIAMLLLARCAGDPFGWQGQQNGRLVNNIVPAVGHEDEQSGASSSTLLSPHTEDAFHAQRANLLMLVCLRNPDRVATTVSSVRRVELSDEDLAALTTPTVPILPDVSYGTDFDHPAPALPTVWLDETGSATLRYDPAYTPLDDADPMFRSAYARLTAELARVCHAPALAPGEILLVDNDVAVHGRVPFRARYDGTDRWLKRVNIRLPERRRRAQESSENGYGQRVVAPFRASTDRTAERGSTDERGSVEQP